MFPGLDLVQNKDVEEMIISSHVETETHDTAGLILMYGCEKVSFCHVANCCWQVRTACNGHVGCYACN